MYLGLDIGTSGVKALLIDEDQKMVAVGTAPLDVHKPQSGWSEQNPQDWIEATQKAVAEIKRHKPVELAGVRSIGLSGQMHGATLIDAHDEVLRPCILWNDTRAHIEAGELDAQPMFRELTGNIVFPGFTAPKLVWVNRHENSVFKKTAKILLPKDYLRLWLTGEYCSDMSDSAGTSWLDVKNRVWSQDLLAACELGMGHMPRLVEGSEPSGILRKEVAHILGIDSRAIVAGGAGDNAASAMATGTVAAGSAFVSLGTSGVIFAANDAYLPNPASAVHTFCHAVPGRWHQMGVILSCTAALNWYAQIVGQSAKDLTAELGDELQAPTGALFLPYLAGERTPHNDAQVRGSFHGLGGEMDRQALTRAVLEGVGFALRDNLEALREAGTELESVMAVGGGVNARYWLKVIATILNLPVHVPVEGGYGAAFGAARLGMLADGVSTPEALCKPADIEQTVAPDMALASAFEQGYERYKAAYRHL